MISSPRFGARFAVESRNPQTLEIARQNILEAVDDDDATNITMHQPEEFQDVTIFSTHPNANETLTAEDVREVATAPFSLKELMDNLQDRTIKTLKRSIYRNLAKAPAGDADAASPFGSAVQGKNVLEIKVDREGKREGEVRHMGSIFGGQLGETSRRSSPQSPDVWTHIGEIWGGASTPLKFNTQIGMTFGDVQIGDRVYRNGEEVKPQDEEGSSES